MTEARGIRTLSWCCAGFSVAVFLSVLLLPPVLLPACAAAVLLSWLLCRRGKKTAARKASLLLLFAAPGFLLCFLRYGTTMKRAEQADGSSGVITARVIDYPTVYAGSVRWEVRLTSPELPRVKCRLDYYGDHAPSLRPGDEIECEAKLYSAAYRYGEETDSLTSKGIFLRGTVRGEAKKTGTWRFASLYKPLTWRQSVITLAGKLFPEDTAPFHIALLTGEKGELYKDYPLYYALSRAGLTHVAAVSGMHVAFLVGFVGLLIPNKRLFALLMLPLLLAFAALSGFTPSVCRAVFMQCCALMAPLCRRESDSPTSLWLVLAILLLINPFSAASVSLQLSFAATAGILVFAQRIYEWLFERLPQGKLRPLSRTIASSMGTSLSALIFTLPLTALHFGVISLVAPLSNVLCLWLISLLFTGGYLTLALGRMIPRAGRVLGWCLGWGDRFVFLVCRLLTALPCSAVYTSNPVYLWWMGGSYLLLLGFWLWAKKKERPMRIVLPACLSALCLFGCIFAVRADRQGIRVTAIEVGQGSCTLIECGNDAVMVDCGGTNTADYVGQKAAYYALGRERRKIPTLVLTHLHRDHVNGVTRLLALLDVETIYMPDFDTDEYLTEILEAASISGTRVVRVREELLLTGEKMQLRLFPPLDRENNDESGLFVLASLDDWDVLITGDADQSQERRFVQLTDVPDIELLIAGHHGSANASGGMFLDALKPETALISVGYNTYGHPAEETLTRLEERHIEIHRTDIEGNITVKGGA